MFIYFCQLNTCRRRLPVDLPKKEKKLVFKADLRGLFATE